MADLGSGKDRTLVVLYISKEGTFVITKQQTRCLVLDFSFRALTDLMWEFVHLERNESGKCEFWR